MRAVAVDGLPRLHLTPIPLVICDPPRIVVEADSDQGERIRLVFEPYQAIRMVTADCFEVPDGMTITPQIITEIKESAWIDVLRMCSKKTDRDANFMDKARHFLLPLQDDFLEVVAWDARVEPIA